MSKSPNFQHPLSVLFDEETKNMLTELQQKGRVSKGQVIRQAIRNVYLMTVKRSPTCANGNACHCPHTHQYPAGQ